MRYYSGREVDECVKVYLLTARHCAVKINSSMAIKNAQYWLSSYKALDLLIDCHRWNYFWRSSNCRAFPFKVTGARFTKFC